MTTFKAEIFKHQKKKDGTYNVKIRITHNRISKRLPTAIFITKDDITKTFKIKNETIIFQINEIINTYRKGCNDLGLRSFNMDIDQIISYLTGLSANQNKDIDFLKFSLDWIRQNKEKKGIRNYTSAINSLIKFTGRNQLGISEITSPFLSRYEAFICKNKEEKDLKLNKTGKRIASNRALSLYMGSLRHLHNEAKKAYNDEECGNILIPYSPFAKYSIPKQPQARKRAIDSKIIKAIFDLPYKSNANGSVKDCRYNFAKDMFILSFGLIGMNSVDLYSCSVIKNDTITYNRTKTKGRRDDKAEISVIIHPFMQDLYRKYKDPTGKLIFNFHLKYSSAGCFNSAINKGLKEIGTLLKIEDLEFYAARHSWATIAVNDLKIDKYIVHAALNHIDDSMKITDIYIIKDYTQINNANKEVIKEVFEKKK